MATKNLIELEKYMILSEFTSELSDILREKWNTLFITDKNPYLISKDFDFKIRILQEVCYGDIDQIKEAVETDLRDKIPIIW